MRFFSCNFVDNEAPNGAAISHNGVELIIDQCRFANNNATANGILQLSGVNSPQQADIQRTKFEDNIGGDPISVRNIGDLTVRNSVTGARNDGRCNGMYVRSKAKCYDFGHLKYELGNLVMKEEGMALSQGLSIEILAVTGQAMSFTSPEATSPQASIPFHDQPDGAAVFERSDGGFTYVSSASISMRAIRIHDELRSLAVAFSFLLPLFSGEQRRKVDTSVQSRCIRS